MFACYITLQWGPPCSVPVLHSEVPSALVLICLTSHRCLRAVQKMWGVAGLRPRGIGGLSQVNKCVWSEIREGRTQTKIPVEELLWRLWFSECEGCWTTGASRLAGRGQSGCVLAASYFLCVIINETSDNSSGTGCPIGRPIPRVDRGPCSWSLNDLGSNKS